MTASGDRAALSATAGWTLDVGDVCPTPREATAVHAAMRHLVDACRAHRLPLPIVPVVEVGPAADADGLEVAAHLAAPLGQAPHPWRTRGHVWRVDAGLLTDPTTGAAAYPALVPLGRRDGRLVLADLGAAPGLIEVHGRASDIGAALVRLVAGLGRTPWSTGVTVVHLERGDGPTEQIQAPRTVPSLTEVLRADVPDLGGVRGRWGGPARGTQTVVVAHRPLAATEQDLVRRSSRRRGAPVVVAPGSEGEERGVWIWHAEPGVLTW